MTDDFRPTDRRPLTASPSTRSKTIVWLVSGALTVADRDLPGALHTLADHADLCAAGFPTANVGGIILHGRIRVIWSFITPQDERLTALVERPDPEAAYRLLTLIVTPLLGEPR